MSICWHLSSKSWRKNSRRDVPAALRISASTHRRRTSGGAATCAEGTCTGLLRLVLGTAAAVPARAADTGRRGRISRPHVSRGRAVPTNVMVPAQKRASRCLNTNTIRCGCARRAPIAGGRGKWVKAMQCSTDVRAAVCRPTAARGQEKSTACRGSTAAVAVRYVCSCGGSLAAPSPARIPRPAGGSRASGRVEKRSAAVWRASAIPRMTSLRPPAGAEMHLAGPARPGAHSGATAGVRAEGGLSG